MVLGTTWVDKGTQYANIQLVETETTRQVWAEPFAVAPDQAGVRNRAAARIARLLAVQVRKAESLRPLPAKVEAGHFALQGHALMELERHSKLVLEAQALFEKSLAIDANSIPALYGIARAKLALVINNWMPWEQRSAALDRAEAALARLINLDSQYVPAHSLRGTLLRARGDVDHAIAAFEHALILNPNYIFAHAELGRTKIEAGRAGEAFTDIEEAIRLSPTDPFIHVWYFWAGMAALHVADDKTAVLWLLKARQANRAYSHSAQLLAIAYFGLGEKEKAQAVMGEYLKANPGFSLATWRRSFPARNPVVSEQRKRIEDALRHLGVAEVRAGPSQH